MESAFDLIKLTEDLRMEYREKLGDITPSMIASLGIELSIAKLEQLNIPLHAAIGITYACLVYERSKSSQLIFSFFVVIFSEILK